MRLTFLTEKTALAPTQEVRGGEGVGGGGGGFEIRHRLQQEDFKEFTFVHPQVMSESRGLNEIRSS